MKIRSPGGKKKKNTAEVLRVQGKKKGQGAKSRTTAIQGKAGLSTGRRGVTETGNQGEKSGNRGCRLDAR